VQEGQVVLVRADDRILPVFKLHLVDAEQFWTEISFDDGQVLAVGRKKPAEGAPLVEHIESLVVCHTPMGVVAAKATWRKTRSPFAKGMAAALREHGGRWQEFTGTPAVEGRTNKKTGKGYNLLTARIGAINSDEARALTDWANDPAAQAEFEKVAAAYEERVRFLDEKAC
jgi:hypothetical protein